MGGIAEGKSCLIAHPRACGGSEANERAGELLQVSSTGVWRFGKRVTLDGRGKCEGAKSLAEMRPEVVAATHKGAPQGLCAKQR